jgi:hypothetical protein
MTSIAKQYGVSEELVRQTTFLWERIAPKGMLNNPKDCNEEAMQALETWLIKQLQAIAIEREERMPL